MAFQTLTLEAAIERNRKYHHAKRRLRKLSSPRTTFTFDNVPAKRKQLQRIRNRLLSKIKALSRDPRHMEGCER